MWIIKILLVISAIIVIQAENDDDGYSYDRPEAIPAELAFYLNIPAGHDATSYISKTEGHFNHHHQQFNHQHENGHSHFNDHHHPHKVVPQSIAEQHGLSLNYNQHQFNKLLNQYVPPAPVHNLPFIQDNLQNLPFIQENTGLRLVNPHHQEQNLGYNHHFPNHQHQHSFGGEPHQQQHSQFQVQPRNLENHVPQNTIEFHREQNPFQYQNSPIPSQELQPPPSSNNPSPSSTHHAESNHRFMASVSNSFNAPLPFPFGVVPIKFDPLPLKTHLLQERLLPISSYEAKVFYKK